MFKYLAFILLLVPGLQLKGIGNGNGDQLCGKWISSEKNLIVLVYKSGNSFKAKIVWFNDDPSIPMGELRDTHNPDP